MATTATVLRRQEVLIRLDVPKHDYRPPLEPPNIWTLLTIEQARMVRDDLNAAIAEAEKPGVTARYMERSTGRLFEGTLYGDPGPAHPSRFVP